MFQEEVLKKIVEIVKRHQPAPHYKLFLFGSRATGKSVNRSDYDIGIEADKKLPLEKCFAIKEELEIIPVLQKIDFVDFSSVPKDFKEFAQKNRKLLYEQ